MAPSLKAVFGKLTRSNSLGHERADGFVKASEEKLFTKTNPLVDGEDCLHDCDSCAVHLPAKWSIEENDKLYGHINGWNTHMVVATGKTDWVKDVADEKGSLMEAVGKHGRDLANGKLMLSASNMPVHLEHSHANDEKAATTVLILPAFVLIEGVKPSAIPNLLDSYVSALPTNTSVLSGQPLPPPPANLSIRDCPHQYLILCCSQKTRDARCGQSAPLLKREFERHLRPLGLYRDLQDERPGGVGIYFISHVGGHKYSANIMIYRRAGSPGTESGPEDFVEKEDRNGEAIPGRREAAQCIWLARVRPEDCENLVRYTILQGKVVKPESQLRGGFDRGKGLTSW